MSEPKKPLTLDGRPSLEIGGLYRCLHSLAIGMECREGMVYPQEVVFILDIQVEDPLVRSIMARIKVIHRDMVGYLILPLTYTSMSFYFQKVEEGNL